MTVYADYEYYTETYGGTALTEAEFRRAAVAASLHIDELTAGKAEAAADNEAVKMACCAIAEQIDTAEKTEKASASAAISSQKVGNFSVTYRTGAEMSESLNKKIRDIAALYLGRTGLMYRGVQRLWD